MTAEPITSDSERRADHLLKAAKGGDADAMASLMDIMYPEFRRMARSLMARERHNLTLGLTGGALVNELWARALTPEQAAGDGLSGVDNTAELRSIAWLRMHRILIEHSRRRSRAKRKGVRVDIDQAYDLAAPSGSKELGLALQQAVAKLREEHPKWAAAVELRLIEGLKLSEAATKLGVPLGTFRHWVELGTAFLRHQMESQPGEAASTVS